MTNRIIHVTELYISTAPAGNRTRGESMATIHFTTKPLALTIYNTNATHYYTQYRAYIYLPTHTLTQQHTSSNNATHPPICGLDHPSQGASGKPLYTGDHRHYRASHHILWDWYTSPLLLPQSLVEILLHVLVLLLVDIRVTSVHDCFCGKKEETN